MYTIAVVRVDEVFLRLVIRHVHVSLARDNGVEVTDPSACGVFCKLIVVLDDVAYSCLG